MRGCTPELIASVRHRHQDTTDSIAAIAADHGISERTVYRLAKEGGWVRRHDRPRFDLPPAMRLAEETRLMLEAQAAATPGPAAPIDAVDAAHTVLSHVARLEKLVEQEIAAEEAVRAQLGALPRKRADAQAAARTLTTLTEALHGLARLRAGVHPGGPDDDDIPHDIDAFRRELARRIDAFVASRTDAPGD
jgi:hypothetical protein